MTSTSQQTAMSGSPNIAINLPSIDNEHIHRHFIRSAGAVYGGVAAIVLALAVWGQNVAALRNISALLSWQLLALGLLIFIPLGTLIGWLSAAARWSAFTLGWWIVGVAVMAWLAGHLPYEGFSFIARLHDLYPPPYPMYPDSAPAASFAAFSAVIGALAGLFVGLLSLPALDHAWNYSTGRHRLGVRSMLGLLVCVPPLITAGLMIDFQINAPLRGAMVEVDRALQLASNPATDLTTARLGFLQSLRSQLSPEYTLTWVQNSPELNTFTLDAQFDTGLLMRCGYSYGTISLCSNVGQNTHDWMSQLMTVGHLTCTGCDVQVAQNTRSWLAAMLPRLGNLREVRLLAHSGGWLYQRAGFDSGRTVDCRFTGNRPITVDLCIEAMD
jgi:hypothetical protein